MLNVRFKIIPYDDKDVVITDEKEFGLANNLLHSLFSKVELTLQDKVVTSTNQFYPYRAYFEKLLGFSEEAKETYLTVSGWSSSAAKKLLKANTTLDLWDRLHIDLCNQPRLVIGGLHIKLALQVQKPEFYVFGEKIKSVKIEWENLSLYIKHTKLSDFQIHRHITQLNKSPFNYVISRNEIRQFIIPKGLVTYPLDNIVNGALPRRMILAMVDNSAQNGSFKQDPFKIQHFNVNYISVSVNSDNYPSIPYRPDFERKLCAREYRDLFNGLNQVGVRPVPSITYESFIDGSTLFVFNFSPDLSDGCDSHLNLIKNGTVRCDLKFAKATDTVISVMTFLEFDSIIQITNERNVITDF